MLTFTDKARDKISELLRAEGEPGLGLRVGIGGRGPGGFQYELRFENEAERDPEDNVIEVGDFKVFVDPQSAPNMEGATVDYVEGLPTPGQESGFKIENPNPLWNDPRAQAVQEVLDTRINPGVAGHGGHVTLLDVKDDVAYIAMGGGCQGCGLANVTLKQGVEVMIKEAVPDIREIIDTTDHASGRNPYYQPAKGGFSPLA
jgi:Fe/S biogenesis protein NfuA